VQEVTDRRGLRGSIDHFFRSLATDQGTHAVGIVLSGTGTEGTLGVLTALVKQREPDKPIRVWVPGCATGEEAYSIAIALAEQIAAQESAGRMQIFATDLDEHALDMARTGTYPETISLDVSPQRLRRFFTHEEHRYTIGKSLRDSVTFAVQNLVSDPAFSRLDLVSCRNVMIYLEPQVQEKLLGVFHFALKQGGYLMLGSAEGISTLEHMFAPVSKRYRIYRRLGAVAHLPVGLPLAYAVGHNSGRRNATAESEPTVASLADRELLDHFSPAAVVVKSAGQIVRLYGPMNRYIHLPTGDATLDVLALAHDALKPALHAGLDDAIRHNRRKVLDAIEIKRDKTRLTVRVTIRPLGPEGVEHLWLMIFEEVPAPARAAARRSGARPTNLVRQLEAELRTTKKEQQKLVQQLESSNEEVTAANEEILSMNEELQSTNEELVTSKEELQSMNEELTTLNAQLHDKVQELTTVNDDLANLLVSTDIVTVFLDADLRIKRFTTAATHLLNLLPADVGRPIQHMTTNLLDVDLSRDARAVLASGTPVEREATASDGRQYVLRTLPYRSIVDMAIQGVCIDNRDLSQDPRSSDGRNSEIDRRQSRCHAAVPHCAGGRDQMP
jgi:two-component system CheB/CheR fusion protein